MLAKLRQRFLLPLAVAAGAAVAVPAVADAATPIGFKTTLLQGGSSEFATSLQWGPDGRLYVAQYDGTIKVYTVSRTDPADPANAGTYAVTATDTIGLVKTIKNHDDDGAESTGTFHLTGLSPDPPIQGRRLVTGLVVGGTAANPVIYVSSSDPRWGGGCIQENPDDPCQANDTNLDTNSGVVSRITWNGSAWAKQDLVWGLPRSEENHAPNGMVLDGNSLYLTVGGNTNRGAPSTNFAFLPEYELGAAMLRIDLTSLGTLPYKIPTRGRPADADPWGGNNGTNQGKIVPGGPVQVYAPGFRSAYDIVKTRAGHLYTVDNGANAGWGDKPTTCDNTLQDDGPSDDDYLHLVTEGYYGGHPNPNRAAVTGDMQQCTFMTGTPGHFLADMESSSTDGLAEYTASNFGGAMKGDLIAAAWGYKRIFRVDLDDATGGLDAGGVTELVHDVRSASGNAGALPLDVATQDDSGAFPGTIFIADQGTTNVIILEPNDYGGQVTTCTGADDPTLDEDGDGFMNDDELLAGTNPCSNADRPSDADGDHISDPKDPNDDNDSLLDVVDPFQVDGQNGAGADLPLSYGFDSGGHDSGLLGIGFTGLMANGRTDYIDMFDISHVTTRGAAGVFTEDLASVGDAVGGANTQDQAFQFGMNVGATSAPFTTWIRLKTPFGVAAPVGGQTMGMFIGTGDQDNFVKLVVGANGISVVKEVNGVTTTGPSAPLTVLGRAQLDLLLQIDPATHTVRPAYRIPGGPVTPFGEDVSFPGSWLSGSTKLATGIIANRGGGGNFSTTWDAIAVDREAADQVPAYVPPAQANPGGGDQPAPAAHPTPPVVLPPAWKPFVPSPPHYGTQKKGGKRAPTNAVTVWAVGVRTRSFRAARSGAGYSRRLKGRGTVLSLKAANKGRATVTYAKVRGKHKSTRIKGKVTFSVKAGSTKVRLTGRVAGRTLRAGTYKLTLRVKDGTTTRTTSKTLTIKVR